MENSFSDPSIESIVHSLDNIHFPPYYYIRASVMFSNEFTPSQNFINSFLGSGRDDAEVKLIKNDTYGFSYSLVRFISESSSNTELSFHAFLKTNLTGVYIYISYTKGDYWLQEVKKLVRHSKYKLFETYLQQKELRQIFYDFGSNNIDFDLRISKTFQYRHSDSEKSSKFLEASSTSLDRSYEFVFKRASQEKAWFKYLWFNLTPSKKSKIMRKKVKVKITKFGQISCNGYLSMNYSNFIKPIMISGLKKREIFKNRSRISTPNHEVKPLEVKFSSSIFEKPLDAISIIKSLRQLPYSSSTIIHGNPHVHLVIVDKYDGSSMEIWVLENDRMLIMPQIKTSENSLSRVVNYILENIGEGVVNDWGNEYENF